MSDNEEETSSTDSTDDTESSPDEDLQSPRAGKVQNKENENASRRSVANLRDRTNRNRKRSHYGEFIIMEAEVDDEVNL